MSLSIIVPCFNEEEALDNLAACIGWLEEKIDIDELLFVDDGSSDSTYHRLAGIYRDRLGRGVKIIRHPHNMGVGAAVRSGFLHANGDYVATIDSDCTYDLSYLAEMFDVIRKYNVDVITGSPYHPAGSTKNMPLYRLFLSKNLSRLYNVVTGSRIFTYTSIFRIYRAEVVKNVPFKADGFLFTAEILINAVKKGFTVMEYPAVLTTRRYGESKAKILRMIREHLGFVASLLLEKRRKK